MDASDKVIKFNSLEDLKEAIAQDVISSDFLAKRYCVRFIMLNNFEAFRELTKFLKKELAVTLVDLEEATLGEDKTLTMDMLSDTIKSVKNTALVTPFSELVRFFKDEDFNGFFNDIILSEDILHPSKRIYIPIIGLNNRFMDFLKNFGRINESAPIWQFYTSKDDKVLVYVYKFKNAKISEDLGICQLGTMRDWLKFWKRQAPCEKILCTATPIYNGYKHSKPDSIFSFSPIENAHQFITDFLRISIPIQYNAAEEKYWENILSAVNKDNVDAFSFKTYVERHFNRRSLDFDEILSIWADAKTSGFERWLLKHYVLAYGILSDNSYMKSCLSEINELQVGNQLFVDIAERIFYATPSNEREKYFDERKVLLQGNQSYFRLLVPIERQNWIREKIEDIAQCELNLTSAKRYCTGTFDFEKELFIGWYIYHFGQGFGLKDIEEFYPHLLGYLTAFNELDLSDQHLWPEDYFKGYRQAKLRDDYSQIETLIKKMNQDENSFYEWYYSFRESHDRLSSIKNDEHLAPDKIYWIDGLGAEFIPYIHYLIDNLHSKFEIIHSQITRTTIPSNTHINAFEVDGISKIKIDDFDELAHSGHYKKIVTLIAELDTIAEITVRIIEENKVGSHTIAIVSDHGLSALSRLCESKKLDAKAKHEGRYIPIIEDKNTSSNSDYLVHKNERDNQTYKVALRHSSLGNKPTHEVHGGCTPEEVLVPFIIISNADKSKPISYTVQLIEKKIAISDAVVKFSIMPEPSKAELIFNGETIHLQNQNMVWSAKIANPFEGKHKVVVKPNKGKPVNFEISFYGMGFSNAKSDFDDF